MGAESRARSVQPSSCVYAVYVPMVGAERRAQSVRPPMHGIVRMLGAESPAQSVRPTMHVVPMIRIATHSPSDDRELHSSLALSALALVQVMVPLGLEVPSLDAVSHAWPQHVTNVGGPTFLAEVGTVPMHAMVLMVVMVGMVVMHTMHGTPPIRVAALTYVVLVV